MWILKVLALGVNIQQNIRLIPKEISLSFPNWHLFRRQLSKECLEVKFTQRCQVNSMGGNYGAGTTRYLHAKEKNEAASLTIQENKPRKIKGLNAWAKTIRLLEENVNIHLHDLFIQWFLGYDTKSTKERKTNWISSKLKTFVLQETQLKNGQRIWIDISPKTVSNGQQTHKKLVNIFSP